MSSLKLVVFINDEHGFKTYENHSSDKCLDYLGINQIGDLPKLKDFDYAESQIGENI